MATTTSGVDAWMVAFADALTARAALANVLITTGYVSDVGRQDAIQIGETVEADQEWGLLGNLRRREDFTVNGLIWVLRAGKGEAVIRAVRARAFALLAEIEDELRVRPTVSATIKLAAITHYSLEQGSNTDGRWAQLDFQLRNWKDLAS